MNRWSMHWRQAHELKTPAERRFALEKLLRAPKEAIFRVAREHRTALSRSPRLPPFGHSKRFFFAASWRKNVMIDVVVIDVTRSRERVRVDQLLICHQVCVSLVPGSYLIREKVLAAAGGIGGVRVVNVDEFLCGRIEGNAEFVPGFERCLPRLKTYDYRGFQVRCFWTTRGLGLQRWRRQLRLSSGDSLATGLADLEGLLTFARFADGVERDIRETLSPEWQRLSGSADERVSLAAKRLMNRFRGRDRAIASPPSIRSVGT